MALKDDEFLKELDTTLALHCRDNNYSLVVSVMAEDIDEGQAISCNGDVARLMLNIIAFAKAIESNTNFPFRKNLVKLLLDDLDIDSKKVH